MTTKNSTTPTTTPTTPTTPTPWHLQGTDKNILAALDLAADLAGLAHMDDSAVCGGAIANMSVRVLHKVSREYVVVWYMPIDVKHTRITPCKYHGNNPTVCPDWYVPCGKSSNTYNAPDPKTGKVVRWCKADRKGDPVPVRMSLDRYFTDYVKLTIQGLLANTVMRDNPDWTDPALVLRDWKVELKAETIVR